MRRRQLIVLGALLAVLAASTDDPASRDADLAQWRRRSLQMWSGMGMGGIGVPQIPQGFMGNAASMMRAGAWRGAVGPHTLNAGQPASQPAAGAAYSQGMVGGLLPGLAPVPGQMAQPLDPMSNPDHMATYTGPDAASAAVGTGPGSAPRKRAPGSTSGGATGTDAWSAYRVYSRHDCIDMLNNPGKPIIGCRFASEMLQAQSRRHLGE